MAAPFSSSPLHWLTPSECKFVFVSPKALLPLGVTDSGRPVHGSSSFSPEPNMRHAFYHRVLNSGRAALSFQFQSPLDEPPCRRAAIAPVFLSKNERHVNRTTFMYWLCVRQLRSSLTMKSTHSSRLTFTPATRIPAASVIRAITYQCADFFRLVSSKLAIIDSGGSPSPSTPALPARRLDF